MNEETRIHGPLIDLDTMQEIKPRPKRQRFVATFPSDITQAEFQARLNALKDPSLPVKALWWQFLKNGAVSIRLKKA